jgi:hypothetical protein
MEKLTFEYEYVPTREELLDIIDECEGKHTQQCMVSTFHRCITQIDWTDMKIRSNKLI